MNLISAGSILLDSTFKALRLQLYKIYVLYVHVSVQRGIINYGIISQCRTLVFKKAGAASLMGKNNVDETTN